MPERFDHVKEAKEQADVRGKVVDAAIYAIQEADLLYKIGKVGAESAIQAVKDDVAEYVSTGPDELSDIRNIAQDAAEGIFRKLGFDSQEMIKDFNGTLNEQLGIPVQAE
jgi:hypothetical protein